MKLNWIPLLTFSLIASSFSPPSWAGTTEELLVKCVLEQIQRENARLQQENARRWAPTDLADVADEEIGLSLQDLDAQAGDQWIGGFNLSAWLRQGASDGRSLEKLSLNLQPGHDSDSGFLARGESFEDTLIEDDRLVKKDGLSHHQLAYPLLKIMAAGNRKEFQNHLHEISFMGYRFKITRNSFMGAQHSPFLDGTSGSSNITLVNLDNGKRIRFSSLLPEMIYRYGFYEGRGVAYRLSPEDILEVFPFLKTNKRFPGPESRTTRAKLFELATLVNGIFQQSKNLPVSVEIIRRDGAIEIERFPEIKELKIIEDEESSSGYVVRAVFPSDENWPPGHKLFGAFPAYQGADHLFSGKNAMQVIQRDGKWVLVLQSENLYSQLGGGYNGITKKAVIHFSEDITPVSFDLEALYRGDRSEPELKRLVDFAGKVNLADQDREAIEKLIHGTAKLKRIEPSLQKPELKIVLEIDSHEKVVNLPFVMPFPR